MDEKEKKVSEADEKTKVYLSKDKPWLKYYKKEAINAALPECTIWQYVYDNNKDNMKGTALNYYGKKVTYREFFEKVDKAAKAFTALGVKRQEIVTIVSMHTPEAIYMIYALNRIGAVANMIYPTSDANAVEREIRAAKSSVFVYLAVDGDFADKNALNDLHIIRLDVSDSMPFAMKEFYRINKGYKTSKDEYTFKKFMELGKNIELPNGEYDAMSTAVIVHTGGTTGVPKGVMLSDLNLNVVAMQYSQIGFDFKKNDVFMDIIPPFIGFGISIGLHLPLCSGLEVNLCMERESKKMVERLGKIKPKHFVSGPPIISNLIENGIDDMSYFSTFAGGGESFSIEQEERLNRYLHKHGFKGDYAQGYGMTELAATVCTDIPSASRVGTVGVPLPLVNIKVIDENGNKLALGEEGQICISSPSMMLRYYDNQEETDKIIKIDDNGERWIHTGDIGYVDNDGFLHLKGRIKRIYIARDDKQNVCKCFMPEIENKLKEITDVVECGVVAVPVAEYDHVAVAFVAVKEGVDKEQIEDVLMEHARKNLTEYMVPEKIIILDELPHTKGNKVDYRELDRRARELPDADEETAVTKEESNSDNIKEDTEKELPDAKKIDENTEKKLSDKGDKKEDLEVKSKKQKGGRKSGLNTIFIATCIAVVAIALATICSIYKIPESDSMESSEKYVADLLASGLAIIGIAISVWAGLNIANAIEKKEVEDIKSSVKGINEQFEKKKEDIEKAKKDVEEITQNVVTMRNERRDVNWNTFLLELLETSQDTVSRYFYEQFSETPIEWENLIEMVLLEQDFSQIYNNYGETSKVKKVLLDKAETGINRASGLLKTLSSIDNPTLERLIRIYLHYRITEFHFMNGYMVDKEKSYDEFKLAAKGFKESQKLLKIDLPGKKDKLDVYVQRDNLELAIYFANSIGEACSKVTHRDDIPKRNAPKEEIKRFRDEVNPYSEEAIFYLNIAVKLNEKLPQREVYFRNLGCAYERKDRNNDAFGENAENIISNYRKALKAVISYEENKVRVENIYKTLLAYYHVWLNNSFKFEDKEFKVFSDLKSFESFMDNLKNKTLEKHTIEYLYNFNHISELSVLDNPRFSLNRSMYGFSLSWIIALLLIHNKEIESKFGTNIEEYLKEIHKCVLTLELMQMSDDYYKDLKNRYEILSAYCKEH